MKKGERERKRKIKNNGRKRDRRKETVKERMILEKGEYRMKKQKTNKQTKKEAKKSRIKGRERKEKDAWSSHYKIFPRSNFILYPVKWSVIQKLPFWNLRVPLYMFYLKNFIFLHSSFIFETFLGLCVRKHTFRNDDALESAFQKPVFLK